MASLTHSFINRISKCRGDLGWFCREGRPLRESRWVGRVAPGRPPPRPRQTGEPCPSPEGSPPKPPCHPHSAPLPTHPHPAVNTTDDGGEGSGGWPETRTAPLPRRGQGRERARRSGGPRSQVGFHGLWSPAPAAVPLQTLSPAAARAGSGRPLVAMRTPGQSGPRPGPQPSPSLPWVSPLPTPVPPALWRPQGPARVDGAGGLGVARGARLGGKSGGSLDSSHGAGCQTE